MREIARALGAFSRKDYLANFPHPALIMTSPLALRTTESPDAETMSDATFRTLPEEIASQFVALVAQEPESNSEGTDRVTVGRAIDNDIVIDSPVVSKQHCFITKLAGTWYVIDAASAFGTMVDGEEIAPGRAVPLVNGTQLRLGSSVSLEFFEAPRLYDRFIAVNKQLG